jgi:hypothetical protein
VRLVFLSVFVSAASFAQVNPCTEAFSECKEDCALEFSSVRPELQKKLGKCLKKCSKKLTTCEERELETRSNNLDEGALDKAPASGDVDENGMPNRTSGASSKRDELREEKSAESAAPPRKATEAPARPPRDEVSDSELPKSSRTQLKTDEKDARPVAEKPASPEPKPIVMTPKPETRKKLDEDVRDDGPLKDEPVARRDEPAPKKVEKKKDDLPPPPPKPKEEDHDDLRNY